MADKAEDQPSKTAGGGSKEYILAEDSVSPEVIVDDVTVTKAQSASLTQDQYDRASADEDVKLVEAKEDKS